MPKVDLSLSTELDLTPRVRQIGAMFDAPAQKKLSKNWSGDVPLEEKNWNVGLIVGPSGAGKSSVMRQMFGEPKSFEWKRKSLVDDFDPKISIEKIAEICQAVGFNTIPAWMKPYAVLSAGEKFRVDLARHLIEGGDPIVVDEFTSVVDRQVAHIGSHAVQKYIRKHERKFVAVTCHYDVVDWLQPDWVLEPETMNFHWRSLQRRPSLKIEIFRVDRAAWKLFAPYHYMSADLLGSANCFILTCGGVPAVFAGVRHMPHPKTDDIRAISRAVTLPDFQGLGLAFVLLDTLGSAYRRLGYRFRNYPAHPGFVRAHDRSPKWAMIKKPLAGRKINNKNMSDSSAAGSFGGRPCAVFQYEGPASDNIEEASSLTGQSRRVPRRRSLRAVLLPSPKVPEKVSKDQASPSTGSAAGTASAGS